MVRKLSSVKLLFFLIPAIIIVSIAGTLVPQGEKALWYVHKFGQPWAGIIINLNLRDVYHSFFFIGLLSLLALNLALCSLNIIGMLKKRAGIFVTHTAIMIVLLGGMISGIWGKRGVLNLNEGETKEYVEAAGKGFRLPFSVRLKHFLIEYYEGEHHTVRVSSQEDGWSETLHVRLGSSVVLNHNGLNLKALAYYPDFIMGKNGPRTRSQAPENPALRLELSDGRSMERHWAFAKFPDFQKNYPDIPIPPCPSLEKLVDLDLEAIRPPRVAAEPEAIIKELETLVNA